MRSAAQHLSLSCPAPWTAAGPKEVPLLSIMEVLLPSAMVVPLPSTPDESLLSQVPSSKSQDTDPEPEKHLSAQALWFPAFCLLVMHPALNFALLRRCPTQPPDGFRHHRRPLTGPSSSVALTNLPPPEWGCCYTRSVLSAFSALSIRSAASTPVLPCIRCLHRQSLCQLAVGFLKSLCFRRP